ncbi:two-component sensor histidine kinase [Actinorhabdospora filicis]|uniref:histidine kinase n=1 Tax=Actinorhabdospora filicis TaxID=1785913 RepID=A0A9W6SL04_9ACTN|nr:ATP-binding protein [Actinorhabdospora filicis]GLZ77850.1 two-component sensor histidine kinase [Actinorhabdospora filicis]
MTIKTRLVVATGALLCLATAVIGVVAIGAVTSTMLARVDDQLRELGKQPTFGPTKGQAMPAAASPARPAYQSVAVLILSDAGEVVSAEKAGYYSEPLALPVLPATLPEIGTPASAASADGEIGYRIMRLNQRAVFIRDGAEVIEGTVLLAVPTTDVDAVRDTLTTTLGLTIGAVVVVGVLAALMITRNGLRPVDRMIDTAAAIADGDLGRRVGPSGDRGELARLGAALDAMVSRLVGAITDRDAQQERLRRFVADASHELRTPLATIGGYAELYEAGGVSEKPALDRAMSRVRAESLRMASLVDDMLLLARLDQESGLERGPCDLTAVVADSVDDARAVDAERVITSVLAPGVTVAGDDARLRQVAANLLANARQHTPPGTAVSVTVSTEDGMGVLIVADDGPGMSREHRARAFDRLYRADPSRSRATGGSGLGLAIVASIVAAHRGTVSIEGAPGVGTTVRVALPLVSRSRE